MYDYIQLFSAESEEYRLLERLAEKLTEKSPKKYKYFVGKTYFDFGQNWEWTTVLCKRKRSDEYQALTPSDQISLFECDGTDAALEKLADKILNDKFCPDRI